MHINKAIARIVGDDPRWYVKKPPIRGKIFFTKEQVESDLSGLSEGAKPHYPDYLHDANAALRALEWLANKSIDRHQRNIEHHVSPNLRPLGGKITNGVKSVALGWRIEGFLKSNTTYEAPSEAICRAIIEYSENRYPNLLNYDAIEWDD